MVTAESVGQVDNGLDHMLICRARDEISDELDIDLQAMRLSLPDGTQASFPLEAFARHCLLHGLDELSFLRSKLPDIERYETCRP